MTPFTLDDATGAPVTPGTNSVEYGPAVIVFYRGGWCPYCNLALRTYQRDLCPPTCDGFDARLRGDQSSDRPTSRCPPPRRPSLSFTVLSDPGSRRGRAVSASSFQQADEVLAAQRQLGLDLAQVNAEGATRLPRPTVLVVDRDRVVRFVDVQPDYTARTEVADIVAALAALS